MIVADTHVIIWYALKPQRLSQTAHKALVDADQTDGIICCDISLWEIAMLMQKGRLQMDADYLEFINLVLTASQYVVKPISPEIAELSASLFPTVNKDPANKIIAATSIVEKADLVTADADLRHSGQVRTIW